ncbi:hypothetical protein PS718_00525 [Pseudomonas fluorescens]|uniref:Uncharacterized protein n=1 Tax=Pseudomonas fluorescens TaxID=294 RepID=A0A5E7A3S3_PSEFL|nr:hypothetical protein [Pseudomonas fluorescens]VVN72735.1 hypothetical protein PS718_00525 [Pseudomonas fluorescens]
MPIVMTIKQEIIQQLLTSKTKSYQAEVKLLLKLKPDEANVVKNHGKELSRKIDNLIEKTMSEWIGSADEIITDVKLINKKMQSIINDINKDVNVAENVVKLVGFIDDVVEIVNAIT